MEQSDQELYDQLLGYLAAEGEIEEDPKNGTVVITEFDHRILEQPLRLHLDPSTFGRFLHDATSESAVLYPDISPMEAAWRLFTVHLDEAVQTARPGETELVLGRGGVDSRRPDLSRTPFPPEVEEYIALNEYYEQLIQHYADRGELEIDVHDEVLIVHDLDGRTFVAPLRVHVSTEELRRQMRTAVDPEAAWRAIVQRIDSLASTVDPRTTELELTPAGLVAKGR